MIDNLYADVLPVCDTVQRLKAFQYVSCTQSCNATSCNCHKSSEVLRELEMTEVEVFESDQSVSFVAVASAFADAQCKSNALVPIWLRDPACFLVQRR
jgi:hypothetical protein